MVQVNTNIHKRPIKAGDILNDDFGREYVILNEKNDEKSPLVMVKTNRVECGPLEFNDIPPVIAKTEVYTGTIESGESHSEPVEGTIPTDDNGAVGQEEFRKRKSLEVPFRDERGMKVFKNVDFTVADCAKIAKERELNSVPAEYTYLLDNILECIKKAAMGGARSDYIQTALDFEKNFGGDIVTNPKTKFAEWLCAELRRRGFWFNIERSKGRFCPGLTDFNIWW